MSLKEKQLLIKKVDLALETIRPHLRADGGNVEVVDITESMKVLIRWMGNCKVCLMAEKTTKAGIEEILRAVIPQITGVESVNGTTV